MNSRFLKIILKIREKNYIKWLFYIMVLGYLAMIACFIEYDNVMGQGVITQSNKEIAHYIHQLANITGGIVFFTECLLIILYPIAKITKKFKFPFPEFYFFVTLALFLIKVCIFISMDE